MQSQNRLLNDDLDPSSSNILSTASGIDRRQIGKVEPVSTFPSLYDCRRCPNDFPRICSHRKSGITRRLSGTVADCLKTLCEPGLIFEHVQNLTTGYNRLRSPKIGSNRSVAHRRDPHTARLSGIS